jgi:hypothetical protein
MRNPKTPSAPPAHPEDVACPKCGEIDSLEVVEILTRHMQAVVQLRPDGSIAYTAEGDVRLMDEQGTDVGFWCRACEWNTGVDVDNDTIAPRWTEACRQIAGPAEAQLLAKTLGDLHRAGDGQGDEAQQILARLAELSGAAVAPAAPEAALPASPADVPAPAIEITDPAAAGLPPDDQHGAASRLVKELRASIADEDRAGAEDFLRRLRTVAGDAIADPWKEHVAKIPVEPASG